MMTTGLRLVLAACLAAAPLASRASAGLLPVVNPGFEADVLGDGGFTVDSVTGWDDAKHPSAFGIGVFNPPTGSYPAEAPEGSNIVYNDGGTISQTLAVGLADNTTYVLNILTGDRLTFGYNGGTLELWLDTGVSPLASTPLLAPLSDGTFRQTTLTFNSGAGPQPAGNLQIRVVVPFLGGGNTTDLDHVQLFIPEPASAALAAAGCALLALRRRRTA